VAGDLANFVLVEVADRFDDALEVDDLGEPTDVVMGLDPALALDTIGVDRSLDEIVGVCVFGLALEFSDELLADDFALFLGIGGSPSASRKRSFASTIRRDSM